MSRRAILIVAAIVVVLAIAATLYLSGRGAGGDAVRAGQARVDQRHGVEVRADERAAAGTSAAIAGRVHRADQLTDAALQSTIEEIRNALDQVPAGDAGAQPPAVPVDGLRDAINAATDRANRAADPSAARD